MEKKLTLNEFKKIACLYYGQRVLKFGKTAPATQLAIDCMILRMTMDCVLELKNLSDITDEHCIELGKMCGLKTFIIQRFDHGFTIGLSERNLTVYYTCSNPRLMQKEYEIIEHAVDIFDQLREWGYMVRYKGHDLFEIGLATPPTSNPITTK